MNECVAALFRAVEIRRASIRACGSGIAALVCAVVAGGLGLDLCESAFGQVPQSLNGAPVQVQPYVPEPGVPLITITPGTLNPFPIGDGTGSSGDGTGNGGDGTALASDGTGTSGGNIGVDGSGGGVVSGSGALNTMLGTAWGATAVANAQAIGVNPSALAATCVLESGCQNVQGSGSIAGAFQMTAATYTAMINAAIAQNPTLANQLTSGLAGQMDPVTESIAASEYLYQGAQYLQGYGISDPTVLDVRGYYQFGPAAGGALANATDEESMAAVLSNYPQSVLAKNGITPGETVGQWRASISAKIGNAAGQSVLT
jgi:hypothetical protein